MYPAPCGGIEKWRMENYGNRTGGLHNISFSIINFPFAPPGRFGGIENGKWRMMIIERAASKTQVFRSRTRRINDTYFYSVFSPADQLLPDGTRGVRTLPRLADTVKEALMYSMENKSALL
jgi:hypothetical protein